MPDSSLFIPASYIKSNKIIDVNICIEKKKAIFIEGTVLDSENKEVPNAGIEIIEVDKDTNEEKTIGCIFTNEDGRYTFTLNVNENSYYKFKLYTKI